MKLDTAAPPDYESCSLEALSQAEERALKSGRLSTLVISFYLVKAVVHALHRIAAALELRADQDRHS